MAATRCFFKIISHIVFRLNRVTRCLSMIIAAMKSLSEHSFVAPYRLTGLHALSVDSAIIFSTLLNNATSITFMAPKILVLMHSAGLTSAAGTCFNAAAWIIQSTPLNALISRSLSLTSTRRLNTRVFAIAPSLRHLELF